MYYLTCIISSYITVLTIPHHFLLVVSNRHPITSLITWVRLRKDLFTD